jgi:hypothetical protein
MIDLTDNFFDSLKLSSWSGRSSAWTRVLVPISHDFLAKKIVCGIEDPVLRDLGWPVERAVRFDKRFFRQRVILFFSRGVAQPGLECLLGVQEVAGPNPAAPTERRINEE